MSSPSELGEKQEKFMELEARWRLWVISHPGWKLRPGESRILPLGAHGVGRKARLVSNGQQVLVRDAVHATNSLHYLGLATDAQLFVDGVHIERTDHPAWQEAGAYWKLLDPDCAWGGDFEDPDGNHLSIQYRGMR